MPETTTSLPPTHEHRLPWHESIRTRIEDRVSSPILRRLAAAAMVTLPVLGAAIAVNHGPAKEIDVAGAPVEISTQLGQDYTFLELTHPDNNEIVRQDHASLLGKPLGVRATINRDELTYGFLQQVAADPEPLVGRVKEAARNYFFERAAEGGGVVLLCELGGAGLFLYGGQRLRRTSLVTGTALTALITWQGGVSLTHSDHREVVGSSFLDNTSLRGTEIDVTPQTLSYIMQQIPHGEDAEFYPNIAEKVTQLLQTSPELNEEGWSNIVLVDDLQSNTGMARVAGTAAKVLEAPLITTGDLTNLATKPEEEYIIDALTHYAEPDDARPIYFIAGLHDTQSVIDYAQERGLVIPNGQPVSINGITFTGWNDPRISEISLLRGGTVLRNPSESIDQFVSHLNEETCKEHPDFVVTHDHKLAEQLNLEGCTSLVIGARTFEDTSESAYETTASGVAPATLKLASGGGHATTNIFSRSLERPAQFVILQTNEATGSIRSITTIVNIKGDASLSSPIELVPATVTVEAQPDLRGGDAPKADGKRGIARQE